MKSSGNKSEKNNGKKDGKKKVNLFLVFLISWLVIVTGLIAWFLIRFNDFAGKYEEQYQASLPYHVAEQVTQHFTDGDVDYILNSMASKPAVSGFEDESVLRDYVTSLIKGKSFVYTETENYREDSPEYYVKTSDGLVVAKFGLAEDKSANLPYGFKAWQENTLEFYTAATCGFDVYAPETYKVYVNGIELNESNSSMELIESDLNQYVEPYATIPGTVRYKGEGLYVKPVVTAVDFRGDTCQLEYNEDLDVYTADFLTEFDEYDELSELAISFASTFANYISQDAGEYALDKYFPKGSQALSYIKRNSSRQLFTSHGKVSIHNEEIRDCVVYSDNVVYMEVYVEQYMEMYWGSDEPEVLPTDAHVFFVKIDGKWLIGGIKY